MGPAWRNVLIVLALAAAVAFVPGGGRTADFLAAFLSVAVLASIVMILARVYRENRPAIFGLGDRHRLMLHGALGAVVLAMAGRDKLLDGAGILVFFGLLGGAIIALVAVWRHHRGYGI